MVLLRSISPTPEVDQVFILVFDVPSPKCYLLSLGIAIAVRKVTPAFWKKERKFSKITRGRNQSSQKNAR